MLDIGKQKGYIARDRNLKKENQDQILEEKVNEYFKS